MSGPPTTAASPRPLTVRAFGITDRGKVRQTNEDQFLIAELTKSMYVWQTSLPEPKVHRLRHVITNVVGGGERGVRVEAHAFDLEAADRLLLCSDGLTEMVPNETIAATLHAEASPEAAAQVLLSHANEAGGRDNITVLIVRFDPPESNDL